MSYYQYGIRKKDEEVYLQLLGGKILTQRYEKNATHFRTFEEADYICKQSKDKDWVVYLLPIREYKVPDYMPLRVGADNIKQKLYVYNRVSGECVSSITFETLIDILTRTGYIISDL